MRLVGRPIEVYNYLEPLYNDYRKLRMQNQDGGYALSHVDEVIDQMLTQEYLFDIALPRLPHRCVAPPLCKPIHSLPSLHKCSCKALLRQSMPSLSESRSYLSMTTALALVGSSRRFATFYLVACLCRLTLERLNQLEPWISAMADDFDEAAIKAEEDAAKKQADALLAEVSKERRNTDRLRLKDHGDTRDRRRRSRSQERDRYSFVSRLIMCRAFRFSSSLLMWAMSITQLHLCDGVCKCIVVIAVAVSSIKSSVVLPYL